MGWGIVLYWQQVTVSSSTHPLPALQEIYMKKPQALSAQFYFKLCKIRIREGMENTVEEEWYTLRQYKASSRAAVAHMGAIPKEGEKSDM